jgi:protein CpxP
MPFNDMYAFQARRIAAGAVAAVAMLSLAPIALHAQAVTSPPAAMRPAQAVPAAPAQTPAAAGATEAKTETVEQRITALHDALKITPAQEPKWQAVAKAMRENAAAMDKLIAETQKTDQEKVTAVEDLVTYTKFAQAHVAGLKNLTDDFRALYAVMPVDQKKLADQVFKTAGS